MLRQAPFLLLISTPIFAGAIVDAGSITTDGAWTANISSTDGNFSVSFSAEPAANGPLPVIHAFDVVTITEQIDPFQGAFGSGVIGGTSYPSLIFDAPGEGIDTTMTLSTTFVALPGGTSADFSMSGVLQAATTADPSTLVLNQQVFGIGVLHLPLTLQGPPPPGGCVQDPSACILTLQQPITWTFTPTPEPSTLLLASIGVGALTSIRTFNRRRVRR